MKRLLLLAAVVAASGCVTEEPAGPDTQGPNIVLQIDGVGGARNFRSQDPPSNSYCVNVRTMPASIRVSVGDAGGVHNVYVKVFPASVVPGSLGLPTAPDISGFVRAEGAANVVVVNLSRPSAGSVRTGVVATFQATDAGGFAVIAEAEDYAGNRTVLSQVDVRLESAGVICS